MKLIEPIQKSYENQRYRIVSQTNRNYLMNSISWHDSIEGAVFWKILFLSYSHVGKYDYRACIIYIEIFNKTTVNVESLKKVYYLYNRLANDNDLYIFISNNIDLINDHEKAAFYMNLYKNT